MHVANNTTVPSHREAIRFQPLPLVFHPTTDRPEEREGVYDLVSLPILRCYLEELVPALHHPEVDLRGERGRGQENTDMHVCPRALSHLRA